jgi:6-phospho-beta-glucosidase
MKRVAILGGGAFTPRLCEVMAQRWSAPAVEWVLNARRPARLDHIADECRARIRPLRPQWTVRTELDSEAAVAGADAIVLLARIGGYAARKHDEAFPQRFGQVGDEGLGLGGLANAWRTVPFMVHVGEIIATAAPTAWVINMMAPLGITTQALNDLGLRVVGLCELPGVTLEALAPNCAHFAYGGINHLGWFWDIPERPGLHPLKYYGKVFARAALPPLGRGAYLEQVSDDLVASFATPGEREIVDRVARPTPWFEQALAPCLEALLGGAPWTNFANVPNAGLIPQLPTAQVVEVPTRYDAHGLHPMPSGPLPAAIVPFLQAASAAEQQMMAAARSRARPEVAMAIRDLPLEIADNVVDAIVDCVTAEVSP